MTSSVVLAINLLTIGLSIYVLYQQFKRLKVKDDVSYLRILLLVGTLLIIVSAVISEVFHLCRLYEVCGAIQSDDPLHYANSLTRLVPIVMLAIIYYKDGQCVSGKK